MSIIYFPLLLLVNCLSLLLFHHKRYCKTAAGCFSDFQHVALLDGTLGNSVCLRVGVVVGILGVGINGAVVLAALVEEVELDDGLVTILVALAANEPVVSALGFTGYGDVVGRFSLQIDALVPVTGNVADKLEGVVELLLVLGQVGSHLQG